MLESNAEQYVRHLFASADQSALFYHNLAHTVSVVGHCAEIAATYNLPVTDLIVLKTAAWFHDVGHLNGPVEGHEERGVAIMKDFIAAASVGNLVGDAIGRCILATRYPPSPVTIPEEILCDADSYHIGTPGFIETDAAVWKEVEARTGQFVPDKTVRSLLFIYQHVFFTQYCKSRLNSGKATNIIILKKRLEE